jgi:hypothetical protein
MRRIISAILVLCFFVSGCASIVGKDSFPVSFQSNPDEAKIVIKNEQGMTVFSGRTPTMVTLSSGKSYFHANSYTVNFSKEGYNEQTIIVKSTLSGWYFGNILFGGLIGMLIVDPITGKMWKLPDTPIFGNLEPSEVSENETGHSLKVLTLSQVPENLRQSLVALR